MKERIAFIEQRLPQLAVEYLRIERDKPKEAALFRQMKEYEAELKFYKEHENGKQSGN